jgi:hypothetical protein
VERSDPRRDPLTVHAGAAFTAYLGAEPGDAVAHE